MLLESSIERYYQERTAEEEEGASEEPTPLTQSVRDAFTSYLGAVNVTGENLSQEEKLTSMMNKSNLILQFYPLARELANEVTVGEWETVKKEEGGSEELSEVDSLLRQLLSNFRPIRNRLVSKNELREALILVNLATPDVREEALALMKKGPDEVPIAFREILQAREEVQEAIKLVLEFRASAWSRASDAEAVEDLANQFYRASQHSDRSELFKLVEPVRSLTEDQAPAFHTFIQQELKGKSSERYPESAANVNKGFRLYLSILMSKLSYFRFLSHQVGQTDPSSEDKKDEDREDGLANWFKEAEFTVEDWNAGERESAISEERLPIVAREEHLPLPEWLLPNLERINTIHGVDVNIDGWARETPDIERVHAEMLILKQQEGSVTHISEIIDGYPDIKKYPLPETFNQYRVLVGDEQDQTQHENLYLQFAIRSEKVLSLYPISQVLWLEFGFEQSDGAVGMEPRGLPGAPGAAVDAEVADGAEGPQDAELVSPGPRRAGRVSQPVGRVGATSERLRRRRTASRAGEDTVDDQSSATTDWDLRLEGDTPQGGTSEDETPQDRAPQVGAPQIGGPQVGGPKDEDPPIDRSIPSNQPSSLEDRKDPDTYSGITPHTLRLWWRISVGLMAIASPIISNYFASAAMLTASLNGISFYFALPLWYYAALWIVTAYVINDSRKLRAERLRNEKEEGVSRRRKFGKIITDNGAGNSHSTNTVS